MIYKDAPYTLKETSKYVSIRKGIEAKGLSIQLGFALHATWWKYKTLRHF